LKILFISPRYEGGIGGHALRVAEKLRENGHDVKLMHIPHIPIKNIKNPSFALFGMMKALLHREKYDVVHAWNVPSALVMKFVNARKKILSVHGVYSEQIDALHSSTTSSVVNAMEEKILKSADVLTTDSKSVQKTYREKLGLDFVYLPAPLDTNKFKNILKISKKENQIVYVGRDSYEKGIDILRSIEPKINGNVVYCTTMSWENAMNKLAESTLAVVPSRMESIPQVIKEAFYLKTAVIATNVGGVSEIVRHGENGILVNPENPRQLVEVINKLLVDKDLREKLSTMAHDFIINNFSWDSLLPQYLELYKN
jgi:glycosyltransferase involved in cell wall biosynthesis